MDTVSIALPGHIEKAQAGFPQPKQQTNSSCPQTGSEKKPLWEHSKWANANGDNAGLEDALFNDIDAYKEIKREKPAHRQMVELAQLGWTLKEIAATTGYHPQYISNILRQPWARERMITEIRESAQDDFKKLLEAERTKNLQVLREIRDNPDATAADRTRAVVAIWDRDMGKPNQPFSVKSAVDPSTLTDAQILEQLASSGAVSPGNAPQTEGSQEPSAVG